jgi:23S rRNA (adenine2503-C2)-methyltransferase
MSDPLPILELTSAQFIAASAVRGVPRGNALTAYRDFFRLGRTAGGDIAVPDMPIAQRREEGQTIKFTQRLDAGLETETVILPYTGRSGQPRHTLCVSSQVGCAMGCTFCETARMGLRRNLTAAEIVAQWFAARFRLLAPVGNVVFMGMGEPMDNVEAVAQAIRVLTDANGAAVAPSRITVSTVGRVDGIRRLAALAAEPGLGRLRLAVSINAADDRLRGELMPINRAEPLGDLRRAMVQWTASGRRRVLIEYVLIPAVNDRPDQADALDRFLGDLPCTVNVIPYNPRRDSPWPAPADDAVDRFLGRLAAHGRRVTRRRTTGRTVMAACGQLGNEHLRRPGTLAR